MPLAENKKWRRFLKAPEKEGHGMRKAVKFLTSVLDIGVAALAALIVYYFMQLPDNYYVSKGDTLKISCFFNIDASRGEETMQSLNASPTPLNQKATLKLFGVIPIKEVDVKTVDRPVLVPGGNPFGIKILTDGVMVVGMGDVADGVPSPALEAGIKTGDIIISVNGQKVLSNSEIAAIISGSNGKEVTVLLKRGQTEMQISLKPVYSESYGCYVAGMYVRDSTAGIGTITFYDPKTGIFGGLGHPVCDVDTGEIMPISSGEVVNVFINGINKGEPGEPGELLGNFTSVFPIGRITLNNEAGLFGKLNSAPNLNSAIPMAMRQEVQLGDAAILSTISGDKPEEYKIKIEKIDLNDTGKSKNMVIRIVDQRLLDAAGGIVQGMSGSPIIQNGMLVGAVTHVFVNDPAKGYGIFCDTMYEYANSIGLKNAA